MMDLVCFVLGCFAGVGETLLVFWLLDRAYEMGKKDVKKR